MKKKVLSILLTAAIALSAVGCGGTGNTNTESSNESAESTETTGDQSDAETGSEGADHAEADSQDAATEESAASDGTKILKTAASFAYPSLDVHKEYYGWYTSIYGVSEALFKMNENIPERK